MASLASRPPPTGPLNKVAWRRGYSMAKSPGSWFHAVDLQQHYTEGMTGVFIVKLNNNRDTDERAHL